MRVWHAKSGPLDFNHTTLDPLGPAENVLLLDLDQRFDVLRLVQVCTYMCTSGTGTHMGCACVVYRVAGLRLLGD